MDKPTVGPETINRLRDVVHVWGEEVTCAQEKLEQRIHEATTELSQIGGLLDSRLRDNENPGERDELRAEIASLKEAIAARDAQLEEQAQKLGELRKQLEDAE